MGEGCLRQRMRYYDGDVTWSGVLPMVDSLLVRHPDSSISWPENQDVLEKSLALFPA